MAMQHPHLSLPPLWPLLRATGAPGAISDWGMARVTEILRPSSSVPCSLAMHSSMSALLLKVTKPKPRERPVALSSITWPSIGSLPYAWNAATDSRNLVSNHHVLLEEQKGQTAATLHADGATHHHSRPCRWCAS